MTVQEFLLVLAQLLSRPSPVVVEQSKEPSEWVQVAQVAGPVVAGLAVVVTVAGLTLTRRHNDRALSLAKTQHEQSMLAAEEQSARALDAANEARFREAAREVLFRNAEALQSFLGAVGVHAEWRREIIYFEIYEQGRASGARTASPDRDEKAGIVREIKRATATTQEEARRSTNAVQLYFPLSTELGAAAATAYRSSALASATVRTLGASEEDEASAIQSARLSADTDMQSYVRLVGQFARGELEPDAPARAGSPIDLQDWWAPER